MTGDAVSSVLTFTRFAFPRGVDMVTAASTCSVTCPALTRDRFDFAGDERAAVEAAEGLGTGAVVDGIGWLVEMDLWLLLHNAVDNTASTTAANAFDLGGIGIPKPAPA